MDVAGLDVEGGAEVWTEEVLAGGTRRRGASAPAAVAVPQPSGHTDLCLSVPGAEGRDPGSG